MTELNSNYGTTKISTDFYFSDNTDEKVFAKDLREYDGATLQYVGIMPKNTNLDTYIGSLTAEKASSLIDNLKDALETETYKDGVVTKFSADIPFFKFNYAFDLAEDFSALGITNIFSAQDADLSNMLIFNELAETKPSIDVAIHKADIDFSNDGIKAAAVTAVGGMGAGGEEIFDYDWDVPVEEIDLTFDKPFLFLIRDKSTGEVWFAGTVYEI